MTRSPRSGCAPDACTRGRLCALREAGQLLKLVDGMIEKGSPAGSLFLNGELQLNGCQLSVAEMPVLSSQRPDFTERHSRHTQWHSRHGGKSGRSELVTEIYATDCWHPFSCSFKPCVPHPSLFAKFGPVNPAKLYA